MTDTNLSTGPVLPRHGAERRWSLIRDVLVFQGKLFLDGLRDIILAPLALATGVVAVIAPGRKSEWLFYGVLRLGNHLERWINLFGAVRKGADTEKPPNIDTFVEHVETVLRLKNAQGGLTRSAKERIDKILDSIQVTESGE